MSRDERTTRHPAFAVVGASLFVVSLLGATGCRHTSADSAQPQVDGAPVAAIDAAASDAAANGASTTERGASDSPANDAALQAHVVRARELFAQGDPGGALVEVDRALALAPDRNDLLLARADGLVVLGKDMAARGENGLFIVSTFEDALRAYDLCESSPRVQLGRCRALTGIGRSAEAWDLAQRIMALDDSEPVETPIALREEILGQAAYICYVDSVVGALERDRAAPDFGATEALLTEFVTSERARRDAWEMLANLYLFRFSTTNDPADERRALDTIAIALEHLPEDPVLTDRLLDMAHRVGGAAEAAAATATYAERVPDSARARFQAARALFDLAIVEFPGPGAAPEAVALGRERFERVEAWLENAGAVDAEYVSATLGWHAVARIARGWVEFYAGDLVTAEVLFESADTIFPRGMEWSIEGAVQSGVQGLYAIGSQYLRDGDLLEAARIAERLHQRLPQDANFANNAGFLHRDAGVALEARWRELAALGDPRASEVLGSAWLHMRASGAAYRRALELTNDDVRVLNDAALVFAYYLQTDIDWAEETLRHAIELGEQQRQNPELTESERFDLDNAWGDAHENLGVLLLEHRGDTAAARRWLERALEIGPAPRPIISRVWLPQLDGGRTPDSKPYTILDWGRPIE